MQGQLLDAAGVDRTLKRLAHEIIEREPEIAEITVVGIMRRGISLAAQLVSNIEKLTGITPDFGQIDIQLYRDDLSEIADQPQISGPVLESELIRDRIVILVDDVIYTGRTTRAAIEAIIDCARPRKIRLVTLIDRGHRELPIRPDFIGKNVPTSKDEIVVVQVPPFDQEKRVLVVNQTDLSKRSF